MIATTTSQKRRPLTAPRHVARRASAHRKAVASRQRPTREAPWPPCLPRPRPTPTRRAASNPPLIVGAALGPRIAPLAALLQARGDSRRDRRSYETEGGLLAARGPLLQRGGFPYTQCWFSQEPSWRTCLSNES